MAHRYRSAIARAGMIGAGVLAGLSSCKDGGGSLTINTATQPAIGLSVSTLVFAATAGSGNPPSQTVTVSNTGVGSLTGLTTGTATYGVGASGWLSSATLSASTATPTALLTVQAVTGSLSPGSYTATIPVIAPSASNSPQAVAITFNVNAGVTRRLTLTVAGGGTVTLSPGSLATGTCGISTTTSCLADFAHGQAVVLSAIPGNGQSFTGWSGACSGVTTCNLTMDQIRAVTAAFAQNSTPAIGLLAGNLLFSVVQGGANPPSQSLTIFNSGGGVLNGLSTGTIVYDAANTAWLPPPALSSTIANPTATLTVQPVTFLLASGLYTAIVPVVSASASNSPQSVSVRFSVSSQGRQRLMVTIVGSGTVTHNPFSSSPNGTGYCLNPSSVTCVSDWVRGTGTVLTANPLAGFAFTGWSGSCAGSNQCNVLMDIDRNVTATFAESSPAIALSVASLAFTASRTGTGPPTQTSTVTNGGGGALSGISVGSISYGAGGSGWLFATTNTSVAPATLTLQAVAGVLAPGTYTASVPVVSAVASNSPQSLAVTFTVTP